MHRISLEFCRLNSATYDPKNMVKYFIAWNSLTTRSFQPIGSEKKKYRNQRSNCPITLRQYHMIICVCKGIFRHHSHTVILRLLHCPRGDFRSVTFQQNCPFVTYYCSTVNLPPTVLWVGGKNGPLSVSLNELGYGQSSDLTLADPYRRCLEHTTPKHGSLLS